MFYGPPGAGKKTRIMALLHAIYGDGVSKVKLERRVFKVGAGCAAVPCTSPARLTCSLRSRAMSRAIDSAQPQH